MKSISYALSTRLLNLSTECPLIIYCLLNCVIWKQSAYLLKKCTTLITFYILFSLFSFCIDVCQRKPLTDITHRCLPTLATSPSSFVVNFNEKSLSAGFVSMISLFKLLKTKHRIIVKIPVIITLNLLKKKSSYMKIGSKI